MPLSPFFGRETRFFFSLLLLHLEPSLGCVYLWLMFTVLHNGCSLRAHCLVLSLPPPTSFSRSLAIFASALPFNHTPYPVPGRAIHPLCRWNSRT